MRGIPCASKSRGRSTPASPTISRICCVRSVSRPFVLMLQYLGTWRYLAIYCNTGALVCQRLSVLDLLLFGGCFQSRKSGDMVCARGPLEEFKSSIIVINWKEAEQLARLSSFWGRSSLSFGRPAALRGSCAKLSCEFMSPYRQSVESASRLPFAILVARSDRTW